MALGLTQPLTEMNTRNISWGVGGLKAAGVYGWQPYHLHMPTVLKFGRLNLLEPSGPVQDCNGIVLTFYQLQINYNINEMKFQRVLFQVVPLNVGCAVSVQPN